MGVNLPTVSFKIISQTSFCFTDMRRGMFVRHGGDEFGPDYVGTC